MLSVLDLAKCVMSAKVSKEKEASNKGIDSVH